MLVAELKNTWPNISKDKNNPTCNGIFKGSPFLCYSPHPRKLSIVFYIEQGRMSDGAEENIPLVFSVPDMHYVLSKIG